MTHKWTIKLIPVYGNAEAARFLYGLIQQREQERDVNISHEKTPTWEQHKAFIRSRPYRCWYIIGDGIGWVGYVSATMRNEIGIVLSKSCRGVGIGPAAVRTLMAKHRPLRPILSRRSGRWLANINPANVRSTRMFARLGFKHIQNTYAL